MIGRGVQKAFDPLEPRGPVGPAYWGLGQVISETQGVAHLEADCIGCFATAGFVEVAVEPFIPGTLARITGYKPA